MQINTTNIRIEGLDQAPGAKKESKDDAGGESAFAAFFANAQLDVQRRPHAKPTSPDDDGGIGGVDAPANDKANATQDVTARPHVETETAPATSTTASNKDATAQESDSPSDEAAASAVTDTAHAKPPASSSAKYSITAKDGSALAVKLDVSGAPAAVATSQTAAKGAIAQISVSRVVATPANETQPAPGAVAVPLADVSSESKALVLEAEVIVKPQSPAAKIDVSPKDAAPESGLEVAPETKLSAPSSEADADGGFNGERSASAGAGHPGKIPASKSESHAVTSAPAPVKRDATVGSKAIPNEAFAPSASGLSGVDGETLQSTGSASTSPDAIGKLAEPLHKPEPQIVRSVTQLVAPDGSVLATQTTETRTENAHATGQREVVVIEKTTIQALPEQALRGVRFLTSNGEPTMRIRLVPESLGEVRLEVIASNGEVSVKLASANPAVREILQTHAPGLQHAIAQDGAGIVRITVTSDVSANAWLSSNTHRQSGQQDANAQQRPATSATYHEPKQAPSMMPRREAAHAGNLNVYV